MRFVDREKELGGIWELDALSKKKLFVVALYGPRRVGKTRLLLEFLRNVGSGHGSADGSGYGYGKDGLYFFVNKNKTSADLLEEFQGIMKRNGMLGELESLNSWDQFFEALMDETRKAPPIVFDEFQNFKFVEPSILGILQKNIDMNENRPGLIFLSGSLIGLMKNLFKDSKEPLYGRIKKGMKLEPLGLKACLQLGGELKLDKEELVKFYCLFGGYPKYYVTLEDFNLQGQKTEKILETLLLAKDAPLEDEVNSILSQEFGGRSGIYYSILEAIAAGNNTNSAIAGCMGAQPTSITRQINELKDYFEIIEFEMPYSGKRGIYRICHPLMDFWFSSIYRNFSDYVARKPEFVSAIRKNMNTVYGKMFEKVAKEFVVSELKLTDAKRQWGKIAGAEKGKNTYEIDLMGKRNKDVLAFEFKWKDLDYGEAVGVLKELRGKAKHVHASTPASKFGIVAKKIREKQKLRASGYLAYDIEDF